MANTTHIPRRGILKAIPLAAVGIATASQAEQQSAETPILKLFHEHQALIDQMERYDGEDMSDEYIDRRFHNPAKRLEAEMMAIPCTCAADFAAKIIVDTSRGGLFSDWETGEIWAEARELTGCQL